MGRNERVMDYDSDGKPKPGGKLLPDPLFMPVAIKFCPKCKRVEKFCTCESE